MEKYCTIKHDHSVVIYEIFHQYNLVTFWKIFREIDLLNEITIKRLYTNCNFPQFRVELRRIDLNQSCRGGFKL